jgi:hypothetical protein
MKSRRLPVCKAFVVEFSRETRTKTGIFAGRMERLSSGPRVRFGSTEGLDGRHGAVVAGTRDAEATGKGRVKGRNK